MTGGGIEVRPFAAPSSAIPTEAATAPSANMDDFWSLLTVVAYHDRRRLALHALARRFVSDDASAHDLTQEAIRRVYARPPDSRTEEAVAACLFTAVERLGLNEIRDRSHEPELRDLTHEANEPAQPGPDLLERLCLREDVQRLEAAIERLSPRQREVVRLVRVDGLSRAEAAGRLGVTEDSVKRSLARADAKLRRSALRDF